MISKFIISAFGMGVVCLLTFWWSLKTRKKYGEVQTIVSATVFLLWSVEWFYSAIYFLVFPETFPRSDNDSKLMKSLVMPLLTIIPVYLLFIFSVGNHLYRKNKTRK